MNLFITGRRRKRTRDPSATGGSHGAQNIFYLGNTVRGQGMVKLIWFNLESCALIIIIIIYFQLSINEQKYCKHGVSTSHMVPQKGLPFSSKYLSSIFCFHQIISYLHIFFKPLCNFHFLFSCSSKYVFIENNILQPQSNTNNNLCLGSLNCLQ